MRPPTSSHPDGISFGEHHLIINSGEDVGIVLYVCTCMYNTTLYEFTPHKVPYIVNNNNNISSH